MNPNTKPSNSISASDPYIYMLVLFNALFILRMVVLFVTGHGAEILTDPAVVVFSSTVMLLTAFKFNYFTKFKWALISLVSLDLYRLLALLMWQPLINIPYSIPVNNWLALFCMVSLVIQFFMSAKENRKNKNGASL